MDQRPTVPSYDEIAGTVERLEGRLRDRRTEHASALWAAYGRVANRFEVDLTDRRDQVLSKAAALMLLKELLEPSSK